VILLSTSERYSREKEESDRIVAIRRQIQHLTFKYNVHSHVVYHALIVSSGDVQRAKSYIEKLLDNQGIWHVVVFSVLSFLKR